MSFESGRRLKNFLPLFPLLREEDVLIAPMSADKMGLIRMAAASLCRSHGLADADAIATKVLEREHGISTTLETGLSLPHARILGLGQPCAGMVLIPQGILEPQEPDLRIKLMFLLLSPDDQKFFSEHLKILRSAAALLRPPFINEMSDSDSARAALTRLKAAEMSPS